MSGRIRVVSGAAAASLALGLAVGVPAAAIDHPSRGGHHLHQSATATPIKHLVVIFDENVSFDHYFGTYPNAANPAGEPSFHAVPGTPTVNGLSTALLDHNPNSADPTRLDRSMPLTCDQDHGYTDEQKAFDHGLMDKFVEYTQRDTCAAPDQGRPGLVMDYYDGNTVTALWNYAQHYAMSDNSYDTEFGPSTPGALNLVSGQTHGATPTSLSGAVSNGTVIGDPNPRYDDCSTGTTVAMTGANIGDALSARGISWGWFQGGFRATGSSNGAAVCGASHQNIGGATVTDYSPHHEPFQYYASTANPHHLPPADPGEIGHDGQANHQYDLADFDTALADDNLPAVSFLKAAQYQDGHAGYSDPLDEQHFLVRTINELQRSRAWKSTAVVIAYDDSDGWYDHQMAPIVNSSQSGDDALSGTGQCGTGDPIGGYQDRCGYGARLPMLVISPYSRPNTVDSSLTDQTSILRFIEDNWLQASRISASSYDNLAGPITGMLDFTHRHAGTLILDPDTGQPHQRGRSGQ